MTLQKPCAIRDCPKMAKVSHTEYAADRFALCEDCEMAIILDLHMAMEQVGDLSQHVTAQFAALFNGFRRKRKGVSLTHKSGLVTTLKEVKESLLIL